MRIMLVLLVLGAMVNIAVAWRVPGLAHGSRYDVGWPAYAFRRESYEGWWPLFPGVVTNTLLYAALAWLALFAPLRAWRWWKHRRTARGLCAKCGYDLRGNADAKACSECGAAR